MNPNLPTDKELATSIRDLFFALRRAVNAAQRAGLGVQFGDNLHELLGNNERAMSAFDLVITRSL